MDKNQEKKLRWRNLNENEKTFARMHLMNGCGPTGVIGWAVPEFNFTESCNHHDMNYWLGGKEEDRKKADEQFYEAMKDAVSKLPWWLRPANYALAFFYYMNVSLLGKNFFTYSEKEKTWGDFYYLMESHGYKPQKEKVK